MIEPLAVYSNDERVFAFPPHRWSEVTVFGLIDGPTFLANGLKVNPSSPDGAETARGYFHLGKCRTVGRISAFCNLLVIGWRQKQSQNWAADKPAEPYRREDQNRRPRQAASPIADARGRPCGVHQASLPAQNANTMQETFSFGFETLERRRLQNYQLFALVMHNSQFLHQPLRGRNPSIRAM